MKDPANYNRFLEGCVPCIFVLNSLMFLHRFWKEFSFGKEGMQSFVEMCNMLVVIIWKCVVWSKRVHK
jgi:hypothetical protein